MSAIFGHHRQLEKETGCTDCADENIAKDSRIVVPNYCAAQLPKITVEIKSGRITYRFTGRYDGERSLTGKLLDRMASDNQEEN